MSALIFPATADGIGRLRFDTPEIVAAELSRLAGKRLKVEIKRLHDTRTLAQNARMWCLYGDAVAEGTELVELASGLPVFQSREDVHGFAKLNLLRRPVMTNRGEISLLGTTTTLTISEHAEYMERLVAKLANYGVYIPPYLGER
jgi:hypothetical protein